MAMKLSSSSIFCLKESKLLYGANKPPRSFIIFMTLTNLPSKPRRAGTRANSQLPPEKLEMFKSKELFSWAEENLLPLLKPVEESWQPQDFLPDPTSEEFFDDVKDLRARAAGIPNDYLVCLVGNMVTEEALPTYEAAINTIEGLRDETGASTTPWARWTRMWTAEENRHGDLLNKYLYLTGRCDMRQVEKTVQYLLGSGMDNGVDNNPYNAVIYTSFQERATFISHGNTARHAKHHGDTALAKICGLIAADEKRHEMAYTRVGDKLFQLDPEGMMQAFAAMMRKRITMPALLMYDGQDDNLFAHFAAASQRLGVYTTKDYADMVGFFVERWKVGEAGDLSGEGRRAQEFVCGLAERFRKMEERAQERSKSRRSSEMVGFSWIFNKQIMV